MIPPQDPKTVPTRQAFFLKPAKNFSFRSPSLLANPLLHVGIITSLVVSWWIGLILIVLAGILFARKRN